jgi:hypothetical protein
MTAAVIGLRLALLGRMDDSTRALPNRGSAPIRVFAAVIATLAIGGCGGAAADGEGATAGGNLEPTCVDAAPVKVKLTAAKGYIALGETSDISVQLVDGSDRIICDSRLYTDAYAQVTATQPASNFLHHVSLSVTGDDDYRGGAGDARLSAYNVAVPAMPVTLTGLKAGAVWVDGASDGLVGGLASVIVTP